jgi:hypothetical protein
MSEENVVAAVSPEVAALPAKVVDEAAESAPEVVGSDDGDVTPVDTGIEDLREIVDGLVTTVGALTDTIHSAVARDATPVSVPWTHRGGSHSNHGESDE